MRLFIVRHAESLVNVQGKMMSSTDLPLTEKGLRQAEAAKSYLGNILSPFVFHQVFSSPLLRAKQTAEIISDNRTIIEECRDLREMDLGLLEGLTWEERAAQYPEIDIDHKLSESTLPGGESFRDMQVRCKNFLSSLDFNAARNVLIVSHGITIRVLINCLLGKDDRCVNHINWADNTAISEIEVSPSQGSALKQLGYRTHLTDLGLGTVDYEKWGLFSPKDYHSV